MQKYQDTVLNGPTGRPVAGATVTVKTLAGAPATIYSDNGVTPITSLTTRADGSFAFYAADGRYTITISGAGLTTKTISDVLLEDPADGINALAASNGASLVGYIQSGTGAVARTLQDSARERVSVFDFGAVGNGVADDSLAMTNAAAQCVASGRELFCPAGYTLKLASAVDLSGVRNIDIRSNILVDPAIVGVPVTIGGFASGGTGVYRFADVTDGTSVLIAAPPSRPVFRVQGLKSSQLTMGSCNYTQFYADPADANKNSNGYNRVHFTGLQSKLELTDTGSGGWNNENRFYGGRIIRLSIIGIGYAHNHNKFFEPTMEGSSVALTFTKAWTNQVYGARFEGASASPGITFDANSYSNTVTFTWSGVGNPRAQFQIQIPIADSGYGNMVSSEAAYQFRKTQLFSVTGATPLVANATDSTASSAAVNPAGYSFLTSKAVFTPSLAGFEVNANRLIALSDVIPVKKGDVVTYDCDFDGSLLRTVVWVFDANMAPLTSEGAGGAYFSQAGVTFNAIGYYSQGLNQAAPIPPGAVVRSEVAYIRVGVYSSVGGFFRGLGAAIRTQALDRGVTEGAAADSPAPRSIAGIPTKGAPPVGYRVYDSTAKGDCYVSFRYETKASGALAAGATSLTIASASTIANGDVCGILLDNGTTHWTTVSALSGTTHTIDAVPVGRSVVDGARVVYVRWVSSVLVGSVVYDPPSLVDGAGTTTTVTVTGAALGDYAIAAFSRDMQGITVNAYVSAADTVSVRLQNESGATVDLLAGTLRARVIKQ